MPYKAEYRTPFEKKFKKIISAELLEEVQETLQQIMTAPNDFPLLTGNLKGLRSAHFHRSPEYRIVFQVYACKLLDKKQNAYCELELHTDSKEPTLENCEGIINFIFLDTREAFNNLYDMGKKYIKKFMF
jgi:mRNA-degrading endonuclease YafQ of YafQ-DinJ toxin-antitoxin module